MAAGGYVAEGAVLNKFMQGCISFSFWRGVSQEAKTINNSTNFKNSWDPLHWFTRRQVSSEKQMLHHLSSAAYFFFCYTFQANAPPPVFSVTSADV